MFWWITLGILTLLAILPVGVWGSYDENGPVVKLVLGPVKLRLFPRPPKQKKPKKEKAPEGEAPTGKENEDTSKSSNASPETQKPRGGSLKDFLPLVKLALDFLGDFRRKLRMEDLYLRLILASSDPADLAMNYGRAWAAVGSLLPNLERWFVIKKRDVEVECDFTASETRVIARAKITITLGRLLPLVVAYAVRGIKEFIVFRNHRKGGAAK